MGHLRVPTDAQKSEWTTKTHIVFKKDDEWGRWICDFRPLNAAVAKRATALGDVFTKTRALAAKKWKSGLDAWSGFNQMAASEKAKQLLQIITSLGIRQWECLPFGVTNGPSYFQEMMLNHYSGEPVSRDGVLILEGQPSLLGTSMVDLDALLEIWIDDIQLGTMDMAQSDPADTSEGFDDHLLALVRVLERATLADLRFKLDKCWFAQFELATLGMIAGQGVVKADPKKVQGISAWPRPSRLEDVERFLASTVFIRERTPFASLF